MDLFQIEPSRGSGSILGILDEVPHTRPRRNPRTVNVCSCWIALEWQFECPELLGDRCAVGVGT
jgi:hypothetical protein